MPRAQLPQLELFPAPRRDHSGSERSQKETNPRRITYNPGGCLAKDLKNINHTEAKNNYLHSSNHLRNRSREASPPPPTRRWTSLWRSSLQIGHHLLRGTPRPDEDSEGNHPNLQHTQHLSQQLSPRRIERSMILSPNFLQTGHRSRTGILHPGVVCGDPGHRAMRTSQMARIERPGDEHFSQKPSMASSGTECCSEPLPVWHRGRKLGP